MTINSLTNSSAVSQIAAYASCARSAQTSQTGGVQQDSSQVSDLAKLMKQLEKLRQSDPGQFKAVMAQAATKLEAAAKEAAGTGDSRQAGALNDLAAKFKTASETGEMPDLHGAGRSRGGPPPADTSSSDSSTSDTSSSDSSTDSPSSILRQLLNSYQSQSTDPMNVLTSILKSTLSST